MLKERITILDVVIGALAGYGLYKIATHPAAKEKAHKMYSKMSKKTNDTVDYVSEEEADFNANYKKSCDDFVDVTPIYKKSCDAFVDVTPNDEAE